jgi:hypothetical protein
VFHALIRLSESGARPLLKERRASLTPLHSAGVAMCISSPGPAGSGACAALPREVRLSGPPDQHHGAVVVAVAQLPDESRRLVVALLDEDSGLAEQPVDAGVDVGA